MTLAEAIATLKGRADHEYQTAVAYWKRLKRLDEANADGVRREVLLVIVAYHEGADSALCDAIRLLENVTNDE